MKCKTARELFSLRLDEGLSFEEQRRLTLHLDACPDCAGQFRKLERTVGLVRELPEVAPPDMFLQNVLRAARQAERTRQPLEVQSFGERVREFFAGPEWLRSPRVALAGLALGLVVGVTASVAILHRDHPVEVAQQTSSPASRATETLAPANASTPGSIVGPSSVPVASGPFEDLIAQMMRRLDSNNPQETLGDSATTQQPQWGPTRDAAGIGHQVGAGPASPGASRRGGRVYVVF